MTAAHCPQSALAPRPRWLVVAALLAVWPATWLVVPTPTAWGAAAGDSAVLQIPLPWEQGAVVFGDWRLHGATRHAEFVRLELRGPAGGAHVEVVAGDGTPGAWATAHYRVQPAPGSAPPEPALSALLASLRALEASPGHRPFVIGRAPVRAPPAEPASPATRSTRGPGAPTGTAGGQADRPAGALPFDDGHLVWLLALALLPLMVLGAVGLVAHRLPDKRRILAAWCGASATIPLLVGWLVQWPPVDWLTVLHEGQSTRAIERLYGRGLHAGPVFQALVDLLGGDDVATLARLARLNLSLTVLWIVLLGGVVHLVTARWWLALAVMALALTNPATVNAAVSEQPAALTGCLFLAGAAVVAAWPHVTSSRGRALLWASLVWVTALVAAVRVEFAVFGAAALGLKLAERRWSAERLQAAGKAILDWLAALLSGRRLWLLAALLGLALAGRELELGTRLNWVRDSLDPLSPSWHALPFQLNEVLPLGAVLLVLAGVLGGLLRLRTLAGLPLALWWLSRLYHAACHDGTAPYELLRYLAYLLPPALLLAGLGWQEVERRLEASSWRRIGPRVAGGILIALSVTALPLAGGHRNGTVRAPAGALNEWGLLNFDVQRETRFWLRQLRREPQCWLLARTALYDLRRSSLQGYSWTLFGAGVSAPMTFPGERGAREIVASEVPQGQCVRLVQTLDCALVGGGCAEAFVGLKVVASDRFPSTPYNMEEEYGALEPEIVLAVLSLPETGAAAIDPP